MNTLFITHKTRELAEQLGYSKTFCRCGGYPDCICDEETLKTVPQSWIQQFLRDKYLTHIEIIYLSLAEKFMGEIINMTDARPLNITEIVQETFEGTLELSLQEALKINI